MRHDARRPGGGSRKANVEGLARRAAAGDLEAARRLVRALEDAEGFDLRAETRRLVDEFERHEGVGTDVAIRDVLTELIHLADENGIDVQERLDAAAAVAQEEEREQRKGPYAIGDMLFENMRCDERRSYGRIVIGGDKGDVHAEYAENVKVPEVGVELSGIVLHTSIDGLTDEEAEEIAREIVIESWRAVRQDTFIAQR